MDEDIDPESWLAREVYATYGLAMFHAQVLENGIINLILWSGVSDRAYLSTEQTDSAISELLTKTMGTIKKLLITRRADIAHLEGELAKAVSLRNFLAHQYFRERSAAGMVDEGRRRMLAELQEAVAFFQAVDALLEPLTMKLVRARGISDQQMAETMDEVRQGGFGTALPGL